MTIDWSQRHIGLERLPARMPWHRRPTWAPIDGTCLTVHCW